MHLLQNCWFSPLSRRWFLLKVSVGFTNQALSAKKPAAGKYTVLSSLCNNLSEDKMYTAIKLFEEKTKIPLSYSVRIKIFLSTEKANAAQKVLWPVTTSRELLYFHSKEKKKRSLFLCRFPCLCAVRLKSRKIAKKLKFEGFFGLHGVSASQPALRCTQCPCLHGDTAQCWQWKLCGGFDYH